MAVEISQHQLCICQDSFVMFRHLYNCLPTLHLASQPYMPRTQLEFHYKSGKLKASAYPCQSPQCVDTDFGNFYSDSHNNPYLPRRNHKIYYSKKTHPHLATTMSLQLYISTLLSTSAILTFRISCQHFP